MSLDSWSLFNLSQDGEECAQSRMSKNWNASKLLFCFTSVQLPVCIYFEEDSR